MFAEAAAVDAAEDDEFGDARGDESPAALRGRQDRRRVSPRPRPFLMPSSPMNVLAHEAHLAGSGRRGGPAGRQVAGRKPKAPADKARHKDHKVNTTDPDSKVMATAGGFVQGYNVQAVVNEDQVIVAAEVTDECNDAHQLHPMIKATRRQSRRCWDRGSPATLLADAGYANEENLAALDDDDPDCYIATRNMKQNPTPWTATRGPLRRNATASRQDGPQGFEQGRTGSATGAASRSSSRSSDRSKSPAGSAASCAGARPPPTPNGS